MGSISPTPPVLPACPSAKPAQLVQHVKVAQIYLALSQVYVFVSHPTSSTSIPTLANYAVTSRATAPPADTFRPTLHLPHPQLSVQMPQLATISMAQGRPSLVSPIARIATRTRSFAILL
jgi:hypothetical protein